jgi:hypothetical protein
MKYHSLLHILADKSESFPAGKSWIYSNGYLNIKFSSSDGGVKSLMADIYFGGREV